jgi:hypothetical protein
MERLRNFDELEGTLLPVAVPVHGSRVSGSAAVTAVPLGQFRRYDDDPRSHVNHDDVISDAVEIQEAPLIPQCHDPRIRAEQVSQALARANQIGAMKEDVHRDVIDRATRDMHAKTHYNKLLVEEANYIAQQRDAEGIANYDFLTTRASAPPAKDDGDSLQQQQASQPSAGKGGYQVPEYDVKEYTGDGDYEVSEYKSVYDP